MIIKNNKKILVVDDDKDILEFLEYNLVKHGFKVITASDGLEGLEKLIEKPDLILLDVMMPRMNGYEFCVRIKSSTEYNHIPIIFLTAKNSEMDETQGLNLGANDFIIKPISINKIIARLNANLRSAQTFLKDNNQKSIISIGSLYLNKEKFEVILDNKKINLVKKEFELLFYLAAHPGKVLNRGRILDNVWGQDVLVTERTIDVHLLNIRKKLGKYNDLIETIKGVGYRFKDFTI